MNKIKPLQHPITPCLWFDDRAEEAANFYASVFPGSAIGRIVRYGKAGYDQHHMKEGTVQTVEFRINGQWFTALNGGPVFRFSEAVSMQVICDTQQEIDYYWERLISGGGEEGPCGWCKDRFGLSWQVAPAILPDLLADPTRADRVTEVYLRMKKFIIQDLLNA